MLSSSSFHVFRPADSTIVDHLSLRAIETAPDRLLNGYLDSLQPGVSSIVLQGLELIGEWASGGPPGTRRPDSQASGVRISPGSAIVSDKEGRKYLLDVDEELRVPWPTRNGPAVRAALVLVPEVEPSSIEGGVVVARSSVRAKIGFVDTKLKDKPNYLPLAVSVGNGQDWATDFRRIYQPNHPVLELLIKRFERLEQTVWQAEPEGGVWDREVLGKNWFRYQTVGAAALQSARAILMTYPTTTMERVQLLMTLRRQLEASVEQASGELLQLIGSRDGAGPYAVVLPAPSGE
jgi:hypothetical protein